MAIASHRNGVWVHGAKAPTCVRGACAIRQMPSPPTHELARAAEPARRVRREAEREFTTHVRSEGNAPLQGTHHRGEGRWFGKTRSDKSDQLQPSKLGSSNSPPSPSWTTAPCCCSGTSLSRERSAGTRRRNGGGTTPVKQAKRLAWALPAQAEVPSGGRHRHSRVMVGRRWSR